MVRSILTVLDGGPGDSSAHATAVRLVQHGTARVRVLGLSDRRRSTRHEAVPLGAMHHKQTADRRRHAGLQATIRARAATLADACGRLGAACSITLAEGDPRETLARHWCEADLVLLGRERRGEGTASFPPQSLLQLLHDCPRPVLVSCEAGKETPGTVAIAYDGSRPAEQTLETYLRLGLAAGRHLEVVCLHRDPAVLKNLVRKATDLCARYNVSYQTYSVRCVRHPRAVLSNLLLALKPSTLVLSADEGDAWRHFPFGAEPVRRLMRGTAANLFVHH